MKIENVTPASHRCAAGACPAIYESERDTFLVVGKMVSSPPEELAGKVGPEEAVVEVPVGLIRGLVQSSGTVGKDRDEGKQGNKGLP